MIHHLLVPLAEYIESFRLFESVHLRALCAGLTAFLIGIVVGPGIIDRLGQLRWRERIASDSDKLTALNEQAGKGGTPTMGGMILVLSTATGTLLFARLDQRSFGVDDVIRDGEFAFERGLGRDSRFGLIRRKAIALAQPGDLRLARATHDDQAMKVTMGAGFDQQRSVEDSNSNAQLACAILESPGRLGAHGRVQDPLECLPCIGIGKHDLA